MCTKSFKYDALHPTPVYICKREREREREFGAKRDWMNNFRFRWWDFQISFKATTTFWWKLDSMYEVTVCKPFCWRVFFLTIAGKHKDHCHFSIEIVYKCTVGVVKHISLFNRRANLVCKQPDEMGIGNVHYYLILIFWHFIVFIH